MKKGLYAIRDNVANGIIGTHPVHVHAHDAPAIRMFSDIASAEGNIVNQHLRDHDLIRVGHIDDETGTITPEEAPVVVLAGGALFEAWQAAAQTTSKEA